MLGRGGRIGGAGGCGVRGGPRGGGEAGEATGSRRDEAGGASTLGAATAPVRCGGGGGAAGGAGGCTFGGAACGFAVATAGAGDTVGSRDGVGAARSCLSKAPRRVCSDARVSSSLSKRRRARSARTNAATGRANQITAQRRPNGTTVARHQSGFRWGRQRNFRAKPMSAIRCVHRTAIRCATSRRWQSAARREPSIDTLG